MGVRTPRDTVREREVLKWHSRGYTYAEIGDILDISRQRAYQIVKRAKDDGTYK